jgi:hypothetical protein
MGWKGQPLERKNRSEKMGQGKHSPQAEKNGALYSIQRQTLGKHQEKDHELGGRSSRSLKRVQKRGLEAKVCSKSCRKSSGTLCKTSNGI